jgi:hypothetical protein
LKTAVGSLAAAYSKFFRGESFDQFRNGSARHIQLLGNLTRIQSIRVEQHAQDDPLGNGHAVGFDLGFKGVGNVVRHVPQPIAQMVFQIADR